jgi:hypothetical protein
MRANRKGDDYIVVNHKKHAVAVSDLKIKNLMLMPGDTAKLMAAQRRMPPIGTEVFELCAGQFLNLGRKASKFSFEPDSPPEDHRPWTMSSAEPNSSGSIVSFLRSSTSVKSLGVGLRAGTVAANSTGSKGTSTSFFFTLATISKNDTLTFLHIQRQKLIGRLRLSSDWFMRYIVQREKVFQMAAGGCPIGVDAGCLCRVRR